jgi:hypothetical protein
MPALPIVNAFAVADVDQHALVHFVHVERLALHVLEIPGELPVVGVQCERRAVNTAPRLRATAHLHPRLGLRHAPVRQVQLGIVAAGDPGFRADAQHVGQIAPGVAARLVRARDGVESPQQFSGGGIECADEAALIFFLRLVAVASVLKP